MKQRCRCIVIDQEVSSQEETMPEKIEEDLRTRIYEALAELGLATAEQKRGLVEHLIADCGRLHDLIVYNKIPKGVLVPQPGGPTS